MSRTAPLPSFLVFSGMPQGAAFNIAARAIDGRAAIGTWFELLAHASLTGQISACRNASSGPRLGQLRMWPPWRSLEQLHFLGHQ